MMNAEVTRATGGVKFGGRACFGREQGINQSPHVAEKARMQQRSAPLNSKRRRGRAAIRPAERNGGQVAIGKSKDHRRTTQGTDEPHDGKGKSDHGVNGVGNDHQFQSLLVCRGIVRWVSRRTALR